MASGKPSGRWPEKSASFRKKRCACCGKVPASGAGSAESAETGAEPGASSHGGSGPELFPEARRTDRPLASGHAGGAAPEGSPRGLSLRLRGTIPAAADHHHGGVVVGGAAPVAAGGLHDRVADFGGRGSEAPLPPQQLAETLPPVEIAPAVRGFGDAVGIEREQVAVAEPDVLLEVTGRGGKDPPAVPPPGSPRPRRSPERGWAADGRR